MLYYPGKVWKISVHIAISGFLFCYTFGVFNSSSPNVSSDLNWGSNESTFVTVFSFLVTIGALFGASVAGPMMSSLGRRKSIMYSDLIMIFSSGLTCIPTTPTFAIGRFISGFAAGVFMTVPPNFINEVTPDEMLSKTGPLVQMSTNVGLLFANGMALVLPTSNYKSSSLNSWWYVMFAFPGFIALYQFCYFWIWCKHDSALWLLNKGNREECMKSLALVYTDDGISSGLKRFEDSVKGQGNNEKLLGENDEKGKSNELSFKTLLTSRKYRKMVRVGIMLSIIQQLSGINAGVFYSTSIFMEIGGSVFMSRLYTFISSIVFLIASAASIPLLSRYGRTKLLISGQILLALDMLAMAILVFIGNTPKILLVIGVMLIFVLFAYSLGSTLWLYLGEACIDKALGVSATLNLVFVCVVTGIFPIIVDNFGIQYCFLFFGACMTAGAVYSKMDLIETKDKSKAEVLDEIMR